MTLRCTRILASLMFLAVVHCGPGTATRPTSPETEPRQPFAASTRYGAAIDPDRLDPALLSSAIHEQTDLRRRKEGKPRLERDARLDEAARMHAAAMARHNYLSHTDPHRSERRTPADRARLAGFRPRFLAENVATHFAIQYESGRKVIPVNTRDGTRFSYRPGAPPIPPHTYGSFAASLLDSWMESPGHRENILSDDPNFFGSGCSARSAGQDQIPKLFCVQLFGRPEGK
jgi:uncharacterized protein YkwD